MCIGYKGPAALKINGERLQKPDALCKPRDPYSRVNKRSERPYILQRQF